MMAASPNLQVAVGSLKLRNPVMVASGTFGYGSEYDQLLDLDLLGALCTKGVSLQPKEGNLAPRTVETPCGMLNAVGLQNPGLDVFLADKLPELQKRKCAVIVNIFGNTVEEYGELAARLNDTEGVAALEVNISCPNVKKGGMAFGTDPNQAAEVARCVRRHTSKPVLVKLSPNVTDIVEIAKQVAACGVDGLTLINTLKGMAIDYRTGRPLLGNIFGGLSGPAIRPVAVRMVYEVSRAVNIPIVGCGGIVCWQDAVEFMRAGACAVQVGSATFRNPKAAIEILQGLEKFLIQMGFGSCRDLVGKVEMAP